MTDFNTDHLRDLGKRFIFQGGSEFGIMLADEIDNLRRVVVTEKRRVELLKQQNTRQNEIIEQMNERLLKYEPGSTMTLNKEKSKKRKQPKLMPLTTSTVMLKALRLAHEQLDNYKQVQKEWEEKK